ncbi:MAG: Maf family protein [Anaerolineaceae bacterium]|nr:Maf family protein [Anaerolineaceae bacterium]
MPGNAIDPQDADLPARLVLASASPRRRELLGSLGLRFMVDAPQLEETRLPGEAPHAWALRLSQAKAALVALRHAPPALILAADTLVIDTAQALGKPVDAADARRMLRQLRARSHEVCTAFTLQRAGSDGQQLSRLCRTRVHMRAWSAAEQADYVAGGDPLDKAGAYALPHPVFAPVERIEGSYSNVVGLPLEMLQEALLQFGGLDSFR